MAQGFTRFCFAIAAMVLAVAAGGAKAAPVTQTPYTIGFGQRFAIKVFLNGQGPFDFLLDTASTRTILYEHARARLGEADHPEDPISLFSINGALKAPSLRLKGLKLGDLDLTDLNIAVVPDTPTREDEPDGVLGLDVLRNYVLVLDRSTGLFSLYAHAADAPPEILAWPSTSMTPLKPKRLNVELWTINAGIQGVDTQSIFDLGAGATILDWRFAATIGLTKSEFLSHPLPAELQDLLGKGSPVVLVYDLRLWIGRRAWYSQSALIADASIFRLLDMDTVPAALIGPGLLARDSLAVDFEHRRLYIAPAPDKAKR